MSEKQQQHMSAISRKGVEARWRKQQARERAAQALFLALERILRCWEREVNMHGAMEQGQRALEQAREVLAVRLSTRRVS